jgi:hypothetical protein
MCRVSPTDLSQVHLDDSSINDSGDRMPFLSDAHRRGDAIVTVI